VSLYYFPATHYRPPPCRTGMAKPTQTAFVITQCK